MLSQSFTAQLSLILFLTVRLPEPASGHGRLMEPPNRSSMWRFQEFLEAGAVINYTDNELSCGGFAVQYTQNGGRCGPCGDAFGQQVPRENENKGKYGRGIIVRRYSAGQKVPIAVQLTRSHLGYFEFNLCPLSNGPVAEDNACFSKYPLQLADGTGTRFYIKSWDVGYYNTTIILPRSVVCKQCVLRWHYQTGNSWGDCGNGVGALGCGDQEVFRGCADVQIS